MSMKYVEDKNPRSFGPKLTEKVDKTNLSNDDAGESVTTKIVQTKRKVKKNPTPPSGANLTEPMEMTTEQALDYNKTELNRPYPSPSITEVAEPHGHRVETNIVGRGVD